MGDRREPIPPATTLFFEQGGYQLFASFVLCRGPRGERKGTDAKPRAKNARILCRGAKEEKELMGDRREPIPPSAPNLFGQRRGVKRKSS